MTDYSALGRISLKASTKYSAIGTLYADSPLAVEDLAFAAESENPGDNQTIIVAISHDHYDHLNTQNGRNLFGWTA